MLCLGIETSCDETALALVQDGILVDSVLATQAEIHAIFGGVVPELASREHYRYIGSLFDHLIAKNSVNIADIDLIAVARGPGLLGSLLVGVAFAKGLALASGAKIIAVNHLHAHLLAVGLEQSLEFPYIGLLVSGGHTHLYMMESPAKFTLLGRTLDDAAGEAFDKVGKYLNLDYPAGALFDALAKKGNAVTNLFPRPYTANNNLDFSFSGLKTAAMYFICKHNHLKNISDNLKHNSDNLENISDNLENISDHSSELYDMCASFNLAIAETLRIKTERALNLYPDINKLIVAGGVAANSLLRQTMQKLMDKYSGILLLPSLNLCTDNASMIAFSGYLLYKQGYYSSLNFETIPRGKVIPDDFKSIV